jgi:hypothetical protein
LTLELQDKENVTPGLDCATGTTYDAASAAGNDGAEDYLAQTLNHCTVEANDWHSSLDYLAFGGDVLESHAFEFDRIETNMYDKLDTTARSDAKGVATRKQLDEITRDGGYGNLPRGIDGNAITRHFLRENFVRDGFQVDDRAVERRKNVYLCHGSFTYSLAGSPAPSVPLSFI